jgi:hypothetical protein
MTSLRSRLAAFGTLAALLGLLALSPARPVSALDQQAIRVTESQTVDKEFPPLASMNPLPGLPSPAPKLNSPDACRQATHCDVIPLEVVVPPTLRPIDEFYVHVQLWWETSQLPSTDDKPARNANDLDLVVWDDPIPETGMPAEYSNSDTRPEALKLYRPTKGKYSIVVSNYVGANTGYRLKVEYKPESIVPPFESLAPEFTPFDPPPEQFDPPVDDPETPPAPSVDRSGGAQAPPLPASAPGEIPAPPAPLTPVGIDPDPDFGDFADDAFDEQLAAPATGVLAEKRVKAIGPPKPASTGSLVFWLAIVPLVLIGAGGVWLSKKGSAVLNLR